LELFFFYFYSDLNTSKLSNFSQEKSSLPKCQYAAVALNIGLLKSSFDIIQPGDKSKFDFTASTIFSTLILFVPKVSTYILIGLAIQIA
jgi:hypothetical protein